MSMRSLWLSSQDLTSRRNDRALNRRQGQGLAWPERCDDLVLCLRDVGIKGNLGRNGRNCGGGFRGWERPEQERKEGMMRARETSEEGGSGKDG